jgi:hypothetical protein
MSNTSKIVQLLSNTLNSTTNARGRVRDRDREGFTAHSHGILSLGMRLRWALAVDTWISLMDCMELRPRALECADDCSEEYMCCVSNCRVSTLSPLENLKFQNITVTVTVTVTGYLF